MDSTTFLAGGSWGGLFFFDGEKSINIKVPANVEITDIVGFSKDDFIAILKFDQSDKKTFLYRYQAGEWQRIYHFEGGLNHLYFYSPDSGFVVNNKGEIYEFTPDFCITGDTLRIPPPRTLLTGSHNDTLYFMSEGVAYRYHDSKVDSIFKIDFDTPIYRIRDDNFFLVDKYGNLCFIGKSNHGVKPKGNKVEFIGHHFLYQGASGHLGVSLYQNTQGGVDVYFVNPIKPNVFFTSASGNLYLNKNVVVERGLHGENKKLEWDGGLFFADIDNDGDFDAILSALKGNSLLYENIGDDHFRDVTDQYDFKLIGRILTIYWCDLNLDGNLDFISGDETGPLRFFIGNGFFTFEEATSKIGISDSLISHMPVMADTDGDGDSDLILYSQYDRIRYFENRGMSSTTHLPIFMDRSDLSPELTTKFDFFAQSISFGDYDNDGDFDLFLANRNFPLKLFDNDGSGVFRDVSEQYGFGQVLLAYAGNWGDIDQDGYLDLFLSTLGKNYIFWNRSGEYFEIDSLSLPNNELSYTSGSVLEDLDNDGDLDIVIANNQIGSSGYYENLLRHSESSINQSHTLRIDVNNQIGNRFGIGSQIYVYDAGHLGDPEYLYGVRQISTNQGYCSSGLPAVNFALSPQKQYDILVKFPTGEEANIYDVSIPNAISVLQPVPFIAKVTMPFRFIKSLFLHPGRRPMSFQFIAFLIVLISFNIYLFHFSTWQKEQKMFFNLSNVSLIVILLFVPPVIWILVYPFGLGLLFFGTQYFLKSKRSETNPFQLYRLLQKFNHGEVGIRQLDRLLYLANNPKHESHWEESVKAEVGDFKNYTIGLLKDVNSAIMEMNLPNSIIRQVFKLSNYVINRCEVSMSGKGRFREKSLRQYAGALNALTIELSRLRSEVDKIVSCQLLATITDGLNKLPRFTEVSVINPGLMEDLRVIIPRLDLVQVFSNLFQNSLDALRDQKTKKLIISIAEVVNNTVTIRIEDNGPGVSSEIKNQIFDESFSTKQQSGVGLFHARELLRQYGGDIRLIDHSPKRGACFEIKLMVLNHESRSK